MGQQPLISVCIPCFNGAKFLGRTLESVLAQTLKNFELVIADDKSTDETVSVIKSFTDSRIKFTKNERNIGLGLNWNQVLSRSVGKYVKLLCEDDLLHPECLARQAEILENPAYAKVVLTVCQRNVIDDTGEVILGRGYRLRPGVVNGPGLIRRCVRWGTNLIGEPAVGLFRRVILERTGMCNPSNPYLADLSLWAELLKNGDVFVDKHYLAAFRISTGAATARIGRNQAGAFQCFARALRKDPVYGVSNLDLIIGYALSFQWCLFRNWFIKLHSSNSARHISSAVTLKRLHLLTRRLPANSGRKPNDPAAWLGPDMRRGAAEEQIAMQR